MMKPAALRDATAANEQQKLGEKILKHQAEVDVESHVEEEKAAEFKNQAQHSNVESSAQSPAERKLAEQSSHEDVTSVE